jgi:hypothetical protein
MNSSDLHEQLMEGDVIFIQIPLYPFMKISEATMCWTNHVGILVKDGRGRWMVAESRVPFVSTTSLTRFIGRSKNGRYTIRRYRDRLDDLRIAGIREQISKRSGRLYHTGFNMDSGRQFCSKFVYEVFRDGAGVEIGEVTDFETLLNTNPQVGLGFWKFWFFGRIPWDRTTITPASQLESDKLVTLVEA